ncbi:MAG: hypothetical protein ACKOC4_09605 [Planctomycetia bacterium]
MNGQRILIRLVGTLTCVAAVAAGWDAEAARCHRRRACCYDTCCYDTCSQPACSTTSCCPSACTTSCAPSCERVCWTYRDPCTNCCVRTCGYRVIDSTCCVAAAPACCGEVVVATTGPSIAADAVAGTSQPAVKSVATRR